VAQRLRRLREHGMNASAADRHSAGGVVIESYLETGFNYRMTDVQAALGLVQLRRLDGIIERRRELAARYHSLLSDVDNVWAVTDPAYGTMNYQSFWVLLDDSVGVQRNEVLGTLAAAGISGRRGIMASHLEPAYAGHPHGPLPVTERLTSRSLILPLYHDLTAQEQEMVVWGLSEVIANPVPA
jgi:dTDP-4-amino-4,6-dideoxygalactose transaminase